MSVSVRCPPLVASMTGRDPAQQHRASTPLELLFDLCFVVAVAQAASQLHRAVAEGEVGAGILGYLTVFFAIWWAWMNFTWFASAYDVDDVAYRLLTLLQIAGVLVLAAGVPAAMAPHHQDFTTVVVGYVIMRLAMVAQWLRAARQDPGHRSIALRYAVGVVVVQVLWCLRGLVPEPLMLTSFVVLAVAELLISPLAERQRARTPYHPGHIGERYGLFTLIVLGESVSAATLAVQSAISDSGVSGRLVVLALGGLLLVASLWWIYFDSEDAEHIEGRLSDSIIWGYTHYILFAAAAALGAGLEIAATALEPAEHQLGAVAGRAVALPVAVYLVGLALLRRRIGAADGRALLRSAGAAVVVLLCALLQPQIGLAPAVLAMGMACAAYIAVGLLDDRQHTRAAG